MKEKLISIALGAIGSALAAIVSHYSGVQVSVADPSAVVVGSLSPMAFQFAKGALGIA